LYDFIMPVVRNAIAVRQSADPELATVDHGDMRAIPTDFLAPANAEYSVPCRRLTDSDVAIAKLEIPESGSSPPNRHPGYEILIPLRGEMEMKFGPTSAKLRAEENIFLHFGSKKMHQLFNVGEGRAEAVAVRLYF